MEENGVNEQIIKVQAEIRCAIVQERANNLEKGEKVGDATTVTSAGRKEGINIEQAVGQAISELININVQDHQCGYDPKTGLSIRVIGGQVVKVNEKAMKEISEKRNRTGKPMKTVKGPNIGEQEER